MAHSPAAKPDAPEAVPHSRQRKPPSVPLSLRLQLIGKEHCQVRLLEVAARRDIDDANLVLVLILKHPTQSGLDVALGNASGLSDLDEDDFRLRRDAAIETIRQ